MTVLTPSGSGIEGPEVDPRKSLDAIQAAVLAQDDEFQRAFYYTLSGKTCLNPYRYWHQLTAQDWCDAFCDTLKALGRTQ